MKIIGHRGAAGLAPENTFASFDLALQLGVNAIEIDIRRTKDGKLVIFHDDHIERTTNGTGVLQEMKWPQLRNLDAGSWFDPKYSGERIPLLTEFLKRYQNKTRIETEVKQPGIEEKVLQAVSDQNLLDSMTFTSFDFSTVAHIKELTPQAAVGFLTSDISDETIERVKKANITQFSPEASKVTKSLVDKWHSEGLYVRVWGIEDTTIMKQAIAAGVDGMTVDFPNLLLDELRGESREEKWEEKMQLQRGKEK